MSNSNNTISESEEIILKIIENNNPITMKRLIEQAKKEREWADSTIKTFVKRLVKKGYVAVSEREVQYFMPTDTREKRGITVLDKMIDKFYDGQWQQAVLSFAENDKITQEELENVLDYIKNHK